MLTQLRLLQASLLWTKVLEDFLLDDVQFNWVQVLKFLVVLVQKYKY